MYFSEYGVTDQIGELVQEENPRDVGNITCYARTDIGILSFSFINNLVPGQYLTSSRAKENFGHGSSYVRIGCWLSSGGFDCDYRASYNEKINVTKDIENNVSISFCDLPMIKADSSGICGEDTIYISARLLN